LTGQSRTETGQPAKQTVNYGRQQCGAHMANTAPGMRRPQRKIIPVNNVKEQMYYMEHIRNISSPAWVKRMQKSLVQNSKK
jgi:hypothetical protein|tara:strand:+ start:226 stop:468 length:243 start_codon:yes stop_codon:yes gene_type:complete